MISIVLKDPTLVAKSTPEVTLRREKLTRVVKGVVGVVSLLGVVALGRIAFAPAFAEPASRPANASVLSEGSDRPARAFDVDDKASMRSARGALKVAVHGTKAMLTRASAHR